MDLESGAGEVVTVTLRHAIGLGALLGLVLVAASSMPAGASGGGGCGGPVTVDSGTSITIESNCFTPTVLHASPGDTVTWTNLDAAPHNVGGANLAWGSFEQLRTDRTVSYSFPKPGVHSYVCSLHPGMVGTVVVGDSDNWGVATGDETRPISAAGALQTGTPPVAVVFGGIGIWITGLLLGARVSRRRMIRNGQHRQAQ